MAEGAPSMQVWDLWVPDAAARGVSFARGHMRASDVVLVHAPPELLRVEVSDTERRPLAFGDRLPRTADTPMARLTRRGDTIERVDLWPDESDIGRPVILPGGEVGILLSWWNSDDEQEWRWQVEFYNHR